MAASRMPAARMPDAQTLLIVSEETSLRDPGLDLGLARGDLALAGLDDLAHDDVLDLLGSDLGALERGLDRACRRARWRPGREAAAELADRGAGGREDDGLGHGANLRTIGCSARISTKLTNSVISIGTVLDHAHPTLPPRALLALTALVAGCGNSSRGSAGGSSSSGGAGQVSLVAYSTPQDGLRSRHRRLPEDLRPARAPRSRSPTARPATRARAVLAGLPADYVAFSLARTWTSSSTTGLVAKDWANTPTKGILTNSVVALVVRKGNPKHITGWNDLLKPGVKVVTPNLFSSGSAQLERHGRLRRRRIKERQVPGRGQAVPAKLFKHVSVQPKSGRDALQTFVGGKGDVLISYENEAIGAQSRRARRSTTSSPTQTLLIENPAAVVIKAQEPEGAKAFLDYRHHAGRPRRLSPRKGYRSMIPRWSTRAFPTPKQLFTIEKFGGWTQGQRQSSSTRTTPCGDDREEARASRPVAEAAALSALPRAPAGASAPGGRAAGRPAWRITWLSVIVLLPHRRARVTPPSPTASRTSGPRRRAARPARRSQLTLGASLIAAAPSTPSSGTAIAWVLVRDRFRGKRLRRGARRPALRAADDRRRRSRCSPSTAPRSPFGIDLAYTRAGHLPRPAVRHAALRRALGAAGAARARPATSRPPPPRSGPIRAHDRPPHRPAGAAPGDPLGSGARVRPRPRRVRRDRRSSPATPFKTEYASVFIFGQIESGAPVSAAAVSVVLLVLSLLALVTLELFERRSAIRHAAEGRPPLAAAHRRARLPGGAARARPVVMVFGRAFEHGVGAAWTAITSAVALHALQLTLLMAAIAVPANAVLGDRPRACSSSAARAGCAPRSAPSTSLPFAVPPVVVGLGARARSTARTGWFGPWLGDNGIQVLFSCAGHGAGHDLHLAALRRPRGRARAARDRHRAGGGGAAPSAPDRGRRSAA